MPSLLGEDPRVIPNRRNTITPQPQALLDTAALGLSPVPIAGDIAGLLADANAIRKEPTWGNVGMGLLGAMPFVPPILAARRTPMGSINVPDGVDLRIHDKSGIYGEPVFELSEIDVPNEMQGRGVGSDVMRELTRRADESGATIVLTPDSSINGRRGTKKADARLRDFYKRFGFVENKGRNKDFRFGGPTQKTAMYREPR